eukprot:jgi/Botrbrau1/21028/Bobra.0144s0040.1
MITSGTVVSRPMSGPSASSLSIDDLTQSLSRMLLRGDTYNVAPTICSVRLEESWGWPEEHDARYLDASCLVFDGKRQHLGTVDFSIMSGSDAMGGGAVSHSGDILRPELCEGSHYLNVDLERLPPSVNEIFVTLSAWGGMYLGDILNPTVSMTEAYTNRPLCHYQMLDVPKEELQRYTSVIMCRIYRGRAGQEPWVVEALGQLGHGSAADYQPIISFIQTGLGLSDMMGGWHM